MRWIRWAASCRHARLQLGGNLCASGSQSHAVHAWTQGHTGWGLNTRHPPSPLLSPQQADKQFLVNLKAVQEQARLPDDEAAGLVKEAARAKVGMG